MFGIGETELVLILVFAFLIFGPDKLPGMGRTLGRALRQFRNAQEGFTQVVQTEIVDPATEAMGTDGKKPNRQRAQEFEEDADLDVPEGEEAPRPKRAETFAERKKRLAEEKAAAEAAAKEAEAAGESKDADVPTPTTEAAPDSDLDTSSPEDAAVTVAAPEPPKKPTAADLYSMKRPSRPSDAESETPVATEVSPVASHEVSEERSDERRADGGDLGGDGASQAPSDDAKEA